MSAQTLVSVPIKKQTLAEQMAAAIQASIVSGELANGASLPTEPELAEQFGVSRAVVRDATRILMAQGLVDVQHGRGMFVTQSQTEAFGRALLLALQRAGATAWDVEQFGQILLPAIAALASEAATDEEIAALRRSVEDYLVLFQDYQTRWVDATPPASESERILNAYRAILETIFDASHNQLIRQLAPSLIGLRTLRHWRGETDDAAQPEVALRIEAKILRRMVEAIASRDPERARSIVAHLSQLPPQAIEAMRETPVGEPPLIPISLSQMEARLRNLDREDT